MLHSCKIPTRQYPGNILRRRSVGAVSLTAYRIRISLAVDAAIDQKKSVAGLARQRQKHPVHLARLASGAALDLLLRGFP